MDANVLYPAFLRDVLLSLAHADLYSAKWTSTIQQEWVSSLLLEFPNSKDDIEATAKKMRAAIPDCMVTGYEPLIASLKLPDPKDCHVLAAAIAGHADAIVTWNIKDFPEAILAAHGVEIQTPDEFVVNQIMLSKLRAISALKMMRERWARPEISARDLIDLFAKRQCQ